MSRPESIESRTIRIGLSEAEVGFRLIRDDISILQEENLLTASDHSLILGDPGGGKTTAIKRICRLLLSDAGPSSDQWQYPILILLRNLPKRRGLICHVASLLGLLFEVPSGVPIRRLGNEITCEGENLLDAVVRALTDTRAVLLIDGIDELDPDERSDVEIEIQDLLHLLGNGKLIMTARFGSLSRVFESVQCIQLLPLTGAQQHEVASLWTDDGGQLFFEELNRKPYADLANRPLFLVRLLLLYRRDRSLPYQPCDVYERFARMMLEDWDRERDVSRLSRYANFGPDQKLRFLAALSHYLLLITHQVAFRRRDLEHAYVAVCDRFQLPDLQAEQVAQEIVSHTGLIVQAGFDRYEFSHLSLQEFFCAHHILRDPMKETLLRYLAIYPAPLAIAATMSVDPGVFLALLALNENRSEGTADWAGFLVRLAYEAPRFTAGAELGIGALSLIGEHPNLLQVMYDMVMVNNSIAVLKKSMTMVLRSYVVQDFMPASPVVTLTRSSPLRLPDPLKPPQHLRVPQALIVELSRDMGLSLKAVHAGGASELVPDTDDRLRLSTAHRRPSLPPPEDRWADDD